MPNWHIEFEVTHKYLADAQAALHGIKGISNVGVRPIAERGPREGKNGPVAKVEELLNSQPSRIFTPIDVAGLTNDSQKLAGQKLAYLAKAKRIKRTSVGKFSALKKAK